MNSSSAASVNAMRRKNNFWEEYDNNWSQHKVNSEA